MYHLLVTIGRNGMEKMFNSEMEIPVFETVDEILVEVTDSCLLTDDECIEFIEKKVWKHYLDTDADLEIIHTGEVNEDETNCCGLQLVIRDDSYTLTEYMNIKEFLQ